MLNRFISVCIAVLTVCAANGLAACCGMFDDTVERIFVIRRDLCGGDKVPIHRGVVAHSALLLKTTAGEYFVLEYMNDSVVHLTRTDIKVVREHEKDGWVHIKAIGRFENTEKELNWTRQLKGTELNRSYTPFELQKMMDEVVGTYSIVRQEFCHEAQERLRKRLGLKVD